MPRTVGKSATKKQRISFALNIEKDQSELILKNGEVIMGAKSWPEARDMGRQLFAAIAALLKENGLKSGDISDFQLKTDVSDNFTSVKIAQTVQEVFNFAVKSQKP